MANSHLAPEETGESWDRLRRFREFEKQQKAAIPSRIPFDDPRITDMEFTDNSTDLKPGQWVETEVNFNLSGVPCIGWVQHVPGDEQQNAGEIEDVEAAE